MKFFFDDLPGNDTSKTRTYSYVLTWIHRITCVLCILIALYYLFYCYLSLSGAMQDSKKYGGLGFSHSLSYYLIENNFQMYLIPFLAVVSELLLYLSQCSLSSLKNSKSIGICYFSIILILHIMIWMHAGSLPYPDSPPYSLDDISIIKYRQFANLTLLPSVMYFVLFLFRIKEN